MNGNLRLGLTRDEEQFTGFSFASSSCLIINSAIILTYDRDDGVKKVIEKLRNCPYLNKVIRVNLSLAMSFNADYCRMEQSGKATQRDMAGDSCARRVCIVVVEKINHEL